VYFLSPEQVRGEAVDGRSDGFALAVILYHGLTGRVPHQGDSSFAIMSSIASGLFPPPRQVRPDLPPELETVLMQALASRPVERFPTVHELGRALLGFASPAARERWSTHFLGPALPVTAPVTSPPPARTTSALFPSTLGPVPTLIGYRVEAPPAAEMTERVPAPRPLIWRRTVVTALVLGAVAGALLSLPGPHGLIEWGRKARAVWRSEPRAPAVVGETPRITIQAVPRPPAPAATPPDTAPPPEAEAPAAPTGLAGGPIAGSTLRSSTLSEPGPPARSAIRSRAKPASQRGKPARPTPRPRPRRGSR
jgi:eukaryotic-like serine/threonine-protein kinase